jgi:AAHS family 4-hydroxybenzoate transporter-like MFS transporter
MQSQALSQSVPVAEIIDRCRFRGLPLVVSFFTVLTFVFDGFDIQGVAFVAPELLEQWDITRAALGPVLAAGLVGMAAGSLLLGPLGDRIGRRSAMAGSLLIVAAGSLISAFASSPGELVLYRFITGVGIGGSIPSATALMMEFAPVRVRNLAVSITVVGVPIGGVLGAEVAARLLPIFGWEAVFVAGAILPAALAVAIWLLMPESPKFLARRPARSAELASMLNRLVGEARYGANDRFIIDEPAGGRGEGFMALLAAAFRRDTILIWLAFFTSLLSVYSFFNWLPTVLTGVGLPITAALRGSLVFNLGGVIGALIIATCMTRFGSRPVIVTFGIAAIALTLALGGLINTSNANSSLVPLLSLMLVTGLAALGVQVGLYALAAYAYPTSCRASGVGAAVGVGRIGGIVSSFAGAAALAIGNGVTTFFVAICGVLTITTISVAFVTRHMPPARD